MTERKRLNDLFPAWFNNVGIFAALESLNVPWKGLGKSLCLDMEYHGNISGDKIISPFLYKYSKGNELTNVQRDVVARTIFNLYDTTWRKQWDTLSLTYDPIENYSMIEKMTDDSTVTEYGKQHTRTDNLSHTKTGTETDTPNLTETQTPDLTTGTDSAVHGFNSSVAVPTDKQTQTSTGTNTITQTGTNTHNYNTTDTDSGTQTDGDSGKDTQTRNYTLTRSGNIGVTTSQQMLESERALWMWNFFYDVVFPDIDRVLTIQIY